MPDLIERTRPTEGNLGTEWHPTLSESVLNSLRSQAQPSRRQARRWPVAVAASVVAAVMLAAPVALPGWFSRSAAAEELSPVAHAARQQPRQEWAEGQFLHTRMESHQVGPLDAGSDEQGERTVTYDDYRTADGWTWSDRTIVSDLSPAGRIERYIFAPSWGWQRPDYANSLPTEPHLLDTFLRARAIGSTSTDEAVFVAISDMLSAEAADPDLRAAAIQVLGLNPHVSVTRSADPAGRTALKATFTDEAHRPSMSQDLYLDPESGVLLATRSEGTGFSYTETYLAREVLDDLPSDLVLTLGTDKVAKEVTDGQTRLMDDDSGSDPSPVPEQSYTPAPKR